MTDKNLWFQTLSRVYVRRRLKRTFRDVRVQGIGELAAVLQTGPAIVASNHVCWWDPLLMLHLDARLGSDGHCLMDKENMEKLSFFRWVGAIPLDRTSARTAHADLTKAAGLLDRANRMVVVFPHGAQRPAHLPPEFRGGVHSLAVQSGAPVFPLALRYDFHQSDKPLAHLSIGKPIVAARGARGEFLRRLEGEVLRELERVDSELLGGSEGFESMLGRDVDIHHAHLPGGTTWLQRVARAEGREMTEPKGAAE